MLRPTLLLCTLLFVGVSSQAADDKPATLPPVKPGWTVLPDEVPDGKVEELVNEDESTREDDLRVRGETKKVTVHKKTIHVPDYEIVMGDGGHDLTYSAASTRYSIGKRVWRLFDF